MDHPHSYKFNLQLLFNEEHHKYVMEILQGFIEILLTHDKLEAHAKYVDSENVIINFFPKIIN